MMADQAEALKRSYKNRGDGNGRSICYKMVEMKCWELVSVPSAPLNTFYWNDSSAGASFDTEIEQKGANKGRC